MGTPCGSQGGIWVEGKTGKLGVKQAGLTAKPGGHELEHSTLQFVPLPGIGRL